MERVLRDEEVEQQQQQQQERQSREKETGIKSDKYIDSRGNKQSFEQQQQESEQEKRLASGHKLEGKEGTDEEGVSGSISSPLNSTEQQSSNKLCAGLPPVIIDQKQQSSNNQQQQQQPPLPPPQQSSIQKLKSKITHRSQSSPSSLTTHKFGLRPTPSPPRLIIDHQTGDIVESYPDQQVYLRTYQPIDINTSNDDTTNTTDTTFNDIDNTIVDDSSINNPYPKPLNNLKQFEQYNQLLADQYSTGVGQSSLAEQQQQFALLDEEEQEAIMSQQQQNRNSFRPVIPPPHSGKVYFAHPNTNVDHLFNHNQTNHHHQNHRHQQQQQQQPFAINEQQVATTSGDLSSVNAAAAASLSGSHNNSFKRALNKLNDSNKTDIALITNNDENDDYGQDNYIRKSSNNSNNQTSRIKVTATNASKANALLSAAAAAQQQNKNQLISTNANKHQQLNYQQLNYQQQQHQQKHHQRHHHHHHRVEPSIEDFKLYDLFYNFRILLVILLSSFIIYLLVVPLNLDCTSYRPTYTYISIIVASVNLICIIIFTLFWYCSGVTRTLYANLSSSAFIITIYSILVAVNLALAILFFFINTCHFHKLISTSKPTTLALLRDTDQIEHHDMLGESDSNNNNTNMLLRGENLVRFVNLIAENENVIDENKNGLLYDNLRKSEELINIDINDENNKNNYIKQHSNSYVSMKTLGNHLVIPQLHHSSSSSSDVKLTPISRYKRDDGNDLNINNKDDESEAKINQNHDSIHNEDSLNTPNHQDNPLPPDGGNIMHHPHNHHHHNHDPTTSLYAMSPIEAFWEYIKEQVVLFKRSFYHFLTNYDLKFIGALHALCAICLQYMAMKVAVVRSYFCSPVGTYI